MLRDQLETCMKERKKKKASAKKTEAIEKIK